MKLWTLVENTSCNENLKNEHGLSFYIETQKHKILFDFGQSDIFLENATKLGIDLSKVDIAILSVPGKYAQKTADFLISSDIKYIWNFAPTVLSVPKDVQVWNENLMGNFLQFTYNI